MAIILGLLLLLSAVFRFPGLNYAPPELFGDEIDVGYQAYSLLKTGRDMYSQPLPFYIHSLSEWRAPLLMYATVPSIGLLGLNEWGVRVPEALFGSLAPVILAYLIYQTSRSRALSLWSSFFLAILPWHIHYSRAAFEVVLMLDLAMLGVICFLKKKNIVSAAFFVLTLYTYSTAIVFVPLLVIFLLILNRHLFSWKFFVVALILGLPLLINIFTGNASRRFNSVSVLNNKDVVDKVFVLRNQTSGILGKLFYNKPAVILGVVANNYLRAFSTDFLFVRGDPDYRQNLQIIGELLPVWSVFLLLGLAQVFRHKNWLWLGWLALAPVPAALTADGANHATRLFWMIPPLMVIVATGFVWTINLVKPKLRNLAKLVILSVIAFQLIGVAYYYLQVYRLQSWRWWNVGFKDAMTSLAQRSANYQQVFINNTYEPSLTRFLFWSGYSPALFQKQFTGDQNKANIALGYDGFSLGDKYFFGTFNSSNHRLQNNSLYLLSQRDDGPLPDHAQLLHTSSNGFADPIFYLVSSP